MSRDVVGIFICIAKTTKSICNLKVQRKTSTTLEFPQIVFFSTSISPPIGSAPDVGKSNYIHPLQAPLFPYILLPVIVKSPLLIIIQKHEKLVAKFEIKG